jgi:hypothetical protein
MLAVIVTFRTDSDSEDALAELTAAGQNKTAAIKAALVVAARLQRQERMRAEAAGLAADPRDVAEIRSVREEMDALRAG